MRVISGKYKRRILKTIDGRDVTRPTSDRVKENMFNLLSNVMDMDGAHVLDLFSGSGALGIEALSRGAQKVTFVEKNPDVIKVIQSNLDALHIPQDHYVIARSDVGVFLSASYLKAQGKMHLIFADPPYKSPWYEDAIQQIVASGCAAIPCFFVLEMPVEKSVSKKETPQEHHSWQLLLSRNYGKTRLEIWTNQNPQDPSESTAPVYQKSN